VDPAAARLPPANINTAAQEAMMATETTTTTAADAARTGLFSRVLVGVDRSDESIQAARQAAHLTEPDGTLTLLSVWTIPPPTVAVVGVALPDLDERVYREKAETAVAAGEAAVATFVSPHTKIVRGTAWDQLIKEIEQERDTLVVVGSHGVGRMRGILIGSTATELVHKAPCSVLVARQADERFPRRVVVGVDGSSESAAAFAAARHVADRFGAELWPVVAHGGDGVDKERVATIVDYHHEDLPDEPVSALVAASADADLVIVGSRGLHGLKALGSVSERVAHEARCSTLIVRSASSESEDIGR
jgi:nucleotide-binding universal stress UspA family protein